MILDAVAHRASNIANRGTGDMDPQRSAFLGLVWRAGGRWHALIGDGTMRGLGDDFVTRGAAREAVKVEAARRWGRS